MVYYPPGAEVHPGDEFQASDQEIIDFLVRFKQIYYMPPHLWLKSGCGNGQGKEWNIPLQQQKLIDELEKRCKSLEEKVYKLSNNNNNNRRSRAPRRGNSDLHNAQ
jgi:hypothetical protein